MSNAKWCDVGSHAYSANERNAQQLSITKQVENQWGGNQPFTVQQDICATCAAEMGLLSIDEELESVRDKNENRRAIKSSTEK